MGVILLIAAAARSDVAPPDPQPAPDAPTLIPNTIGRTDPGPADALWHYSDLAPGEQAYVIRNADPGNWDQVNQAFGAAVAEQGLAAAARDAGNQLGVDDLATEGVLP